MKKRIFICLLFAFALVSGFRVQAQIVIIVNPEVKAGATTKSELRDIFTGESKNLKDGGHVMPVLLQSGATQAEFLSAYVHMPEAMLSTCWRKLAFSGQSVMPKSFDSEAAIVEYVARTPGAIGYVGAATAHEGVKTLVIK